MTGTMINALSKETMAKMIDDLEESYSYEHEQHMLDRKHSAEASEIEYERHLREIQKLHKDYGEEIVQLKDEHEEEIEQYKNEIEVLKEDHESDITKAKINLVKDIANTIADQINGLLPEHQDNLWCLVGAIDGMLADNKISFDFGIKVRSIVARKRESK